jgi:hypothetical protein
MAPLPPVANTLKYTQGWHIGNNTTAESILHFTYTGGAPSAADCAALAVTFQGAAATDLKPQMHSANSVGLGTVLDIASNTGAFATAGSVTAGTLAGTHLTGATCVVMNHAIARHYRGGKPRTYAPLGEYEKLNTSGQWSTTFQTAVDSAWQSFITACLAASSGSTTISHFVNVSYYNNKAQRVTPVVDTINQSVMRLIVGTQRRRMATA